MLPRFTQNNLRDGWLQNLKFFRQRYLLFSVCVPPTNCQNVLDCKFSGVNLLATYKRLRMSAASMAFSASNSFRMSTRTVSVASRYSVWMQTTRTSVTFSDAPFSDAILHVVIACTFEQMKRIATGRVIAAVTCLHFRQINTVINQVYQTARNIGASLWVAYRKLSIVVQIAKSAPFPASALRSLTRCGVYSFPDCLNLLWRKLRQRKMNLGHDLSSFQIVFRAMRFTPHGPTCILTQEVAR